MSADTEPTTPGGEVAPAVRRPWTLAAAAVLVVAVVGLVLVFGVNRPPQLDDLATAPDPAPQGRVAWVTWDDGDECLQVLDPTGEVEDVRCDRDGVGGEVAGWEGDAVVLSSWEVEDQEQLVDVATGDVTTRPAEGEDDDGFRNPTAELRTERRDGVLTVEVEGSEVWTTPADEAYDVREAHVSADGTTVLLVDEADRLLIVPADGSAEPRVWTDQMPRYVTLAWEAAAPA